MISVIMSVYCGQKYLNTTIESVLKQSYNNFEFIIINDGSTDGTKSILNYYAQKDIRIKVFNQTNHGLTLSLNRGIKLSNGEYIARIDVGDIANQERFKKQIEFMKNDETIGILGAWYELIDGNGKQLKKIKHSTEDKYIKKSLLTSAPLIHSSFMIRREALLKGGLYNEKFKYAQDRELIFRIMRYYSIRIYPDYLVKLRLDKDSISFKKEAEQKKLCALAIYNAVYDRLYPRWCYIFALRYYLSSFLPIFFKRYKDNLLKYIQDMND